MSLLSTRCEIHCTLIAYQINARTFFDFVHFFFNENKLLISGFGAKEAAKKGVPNEKYFQINNS